jgi:hypothetical protein
MSSSPPTNPISIRFTEKQLETMDEIKAKTGLAKGSIVKVCVEAFLRDYRANPSSMMVADWQFVANQLDSRSSEANQDLIRSDAKDSAVSPSKKASGEAPLKPAKKAAPKKGAKREAQVDATMIKPATLKRMGYSVHDGTKKPSVQEAG